MTTYDYMRLKTAEKQNVKRTATWFYQYTQTLVNIHFHRTGKQQIMFQKEKKQAMGVARIFD